MNDDINPVYHPNKTQEININDMFETYTDVELFKFLKKEIDNARDKRRHGINFNVPKEKRWYSESEALMGQLGSYIMRHKEEMSLMDYTVAKRTGYNNKFDEILITW